MFRLLLVACLVGATCVSTAGTAPKQAKTKLPLLIAHRGEAGIAPENTVAAFDLAWKSGVKAVELDCRLTKDKKIICLHDANTKRTSGVDLVVSKTDSARLRQLDVGKWKDAKYAGEKIPFLADVIASLPSDCMILCEVKTDSAILPYLKEVLENSTNRSRVTIISFHVDVCSGIKKMLPSQRVYLLKQAPKNPDTGKFMPYDEDELLDICRKHKLDGLDLKHTMMTQAFIRRANAHGLKVFVYTCDKLADVQRAIDIGAEEITTNRAASILQELAK